ncbi:hypothetical protein APASM_4700 [Actinosynnema pretiosum subsp. pretiosum]|nr:hypothetical protein APASM_4700 [Actinosynnema pretiosum subsp. pretiosum]
MTAEPRRDAEAVPEVVRVQHAGRVHYVSRWAPWVLAGLADGTAQVLAEEVVPDGTTAVRPRGVRQPPRPAVTDT